ncbi:MAG TPA: hypothetical protein VFY89_05530 [Ktedonobacterales bacterium]
MARTKIMSGRRINSATDQGPSDGYMTRLVKYVPTEFITIFLAINNFILGDPKHPRLDAQQYWIVTAILLVANVIYIWRATSTKGQSPATSQIIVSTILYAIFIYSIGGPFFEAGLSWYNPTYAAIVLPVALFIAGFIVPKPVPVAIQTTAR